MVSFRKINKIVITKYFKVRQKCGPGSGLVQTTIFGTTNELEKLCHILVMGLLPGAQNCGLRMRRECRESFPRHHGLAIPTCITARASRSYRDACRDSLLAVSFEVGGGETFPAFPAHAQPAILRIW